MGKRKGVKILSIVITAFIFISVAFYCVLSKTNIQFISNNPVLQRLAESSLFNLANTDGVVDEGNTLVLTNTAQTSISKEKNWEGVETPNLYKVTFGLYEKTTVDNTSAEKIEVDGVYYIPVYDENLEKIQDYVIGEGSVNFNELPKYNDNDEEINYKVIEVLVQSREDETSEEWITLQKGDHYISEEQDDIVTNTPVAQKDFDLALRKSITGVQRNNEDVTSSAITENRLPVINETSLEGLESPDTTLYYYHPKYAINVENEDIVTYTITVFNEGERDGYASEITDYIPEGLEFIDNEFNKSYGWELVLDDTGNLVKDENGSTAIKTKYLSSAAQGGSDENILNAIEITEAEDSSEGESESTTEETTQTESTQTTFKVSSKEVKVQLKVTKEPNEVQDEYLTNRAEITVYGYYNALNEWREASAENVDIDSVENTINDSLGLPSWYASHVINSTPTIDNYYPGAQDDDDFETVILSKTYGTQIELNKLGSVDQENIAGATFKISDITTNSDMEISIYNKTSGEKVEVAEDGSFVVPEEGIILDLSQMVKNKEYQIQIDEISAPEGFAKTLESLVLSVSLDDNEVVSAQIIKLVNENGEEEDVLNQNTAKLEGADDTGKVQVGLNADDSNITVQYKLGENGEWQNYTEDVKVYENTTVYAKTIKDGVESEVSFKVINNIDKVAPDLESYTENDAGDIETSINVVLTDDASGIVKYGVSTSSDVEPETYQYANQETRLETTIENIENNGINYVWIWDAAGNNAVKEVEITTVNSDLYVAEITAASEGYEDLIGTQYKTLAAALAASPSLGNGTATISLIHDIYNESNSVNKEVTIDLNGYTLTSRKNAATLAVAENSTLTLVNTSNTGELQNEKTMAVLVNETGTFTMGVNDKSIGALQPTITGKGIGVRNNGTFNFYDGNITATENESLIASAIYGKVTETPIVYSVSVTDITEPERIQKASLAVISGLEARIGRKTYTKLEDAVADAGTTFGTDGSQVEIVVVADLAKDSTVVIDETKNIKLDLDGHTYTTTASGYVIENYGELEIVDSSDEQTGVITSTTANTIYNTSTGEYTGEEIVIDLNNVKKYDEDEQYYFTYKNGQLVSNNNTWEASLNTTAKSYIELDLTEYEGRYTLEIDAEISSYDTTYYTHGWGLVSISNEPDSSSNISNTSYGNLICIGGETNGKYSTDLAGGTKYFINIQYEKGGLTSSLYDDEFRINSISIRKKQEGKLTLTNGTIKIEKSGYSSALDNAGIVNINGGKVYGTQNNNIGISTKTGGTTIMNNGTVEVPKASYSTGIGNEQKGGLSKVTGGNITAYRGVYVSSCYSKAIVIGGTFNCQNVVESYNRSALIILDGVTLTSTSTYGIYNNNGKVIVNNSEINIDGAVYTNATNSNIEINNSIINGSIYSRYSDTIILNDSEVSVTSNSDAFYNSNINYGNLIINNSKINTTYGRLISQFKNVTINNSELNNSNSNTKYEAIRVAGGDVNITGDTTILTAGAVIYSESNNSSNINIESGTFESTNYQIIQMLNSTGTITLGKKDGNVTEKPVLKSALTAWTLYGNSMNLYFYDGKLIGKEDTIIGMPIVELEENKQLVSNINEEGYEEITLGEVDAVAQIVETEEIYETLEAAISACDTNAGEVQNTIKLLKNIKQVNQVKISNGQNIKIDLNGNKMYALTNDTLYNEGKLEIVDTSENSQYEYNLITTAGNTIIENAVIENEDGTITNSQAIIGNGVKIYYIGTGTSSNYRTIIENNSELILNGGTITLNASAYIKAINNINNATFTMKDGIINLYGGNTYGIYNSNQSNCILETGTINLNEAYEYGIYSNSTGNVEINKLDDKENFRIAMNSSYDNGIYIQSGNLHIQDIYITSTYYYYSYAIYNNGTMIIDNATIEGSYHSPNSAGAIMAKGTTTINNATININYGQSGLSIEGNCYIKNININNTHQYEICTQYYATSTTTIENCNINSNGIGIFNQYGTNTMNIKAGNITSSNDYGINNASTLTLGEKLTEEGLIQGEKADSTNPIIKGKSYGVYNTNVLNYYDGSIIGAVGKSIYGNTTDIEKGYQIVKTVNEENTLETSKLQEVSIIEIEGVGQYTTIEELQKNIDGLDNTQEYTIRALEDFSISISTSSITIPENMTATFDINGCEIVAANENTIINKGNLTIKDSTEENLGSIVNSNSRAIVAQDTANLTISDVVITSSVANNVIENEGTGNVVIENATISNTAGGVCVYENGGGTVTIDNTTITTTGSSVYNNNSNSTITVNSGTIGNIYNNAEIKKDNSENIIINGGTFSQVYNNTSGMILINDINIDINTNNEVIYNYSTGVITINNGTIKVSRGYSNGQIIYNYGGGIVNINGGTITALSDNSVVTNRNSIVNIAGGTFNSNSGETINNSGYSADSVTNITGGTFTSTSGSVIYNTQTNEGESTVNITKATITTDSGYGIYNFQTLNLGTNDENIETSENIKIISNNSYGLVSVSGSKCNYYDGIIQGATDKSIYGRISSMPENTEILLEKGNVEIAKLGNEGVAKIGDTPYNSLREAIAACDSDESTTITILKDFAIGGEDYTISETQNIVIDLNGHKINQYNKIINNGTLEITDNTDEKLGIIDTSDRLIDNTGYFKLSNIKINSYMWTNESPYGSSFPGTRYIIYNYEDGYVELENEYIYNKINGRGVSHIIHTASTNNVVLKNGTIETVNWYYNNTHSNSYVVYSENTSEEINGIVLDGVNFIESGAGYSYGIYGSTSSDVTINSGNIENYALSGKGNNLTINGGTIKGTINASAFTTSTINDGTIMSTTQLGGTAIINGGNIDNVSTSGSDSNIVMHGGSIYNTDGIALNISGGTFTLLGGTIESTNGYGVQISNSTSTFIMGNNEDSVSTQIPEVKGSTYGVYNSNGTFKFYDGIITGATNAIYGSVTDMPDSYKVVTELNDTIAYLDIVTETENIVSVDGIYYTSIESALTAAAQTSGTILLAKDFELTSPITIPAEANITINLNAHNITYNSSEAAITNNGTLTIIDDVENAVEGGEVVQAKIENTSGVAIQNEGTLTIGVDDGTVDTVTPNIIGTPDAIINNGTLNLYDGLLNGTPVTVGTTVATYRTHIITKSPSEEVTIYKLAQKEKLSADSTVKTGTTVVETSVISPTITVDKELPVWTNEYVVTTINTKDRVVLNITNTEKNMYVVKLNKTDESGNNLQGITFTTQATDGEGNAIEMPNATIANEVTTTGTKEPLTIVTNKITEDTVDVVDYFEITETVVPKEYYGLASALKLTIEKQLNTETGFYDISSFAINGNTDTDEDGIITLDVELEGSEEPAEVKATLEDNTIVIVVENNKITTTRTVQKVWNMPEAEAANYRATVTLYKVVNGEKTVVTNSDGTERNAVITGNNTAVFDNLEVYENDELITYYIEETKIEKCVGTDGQTGEKVWEDVTGKFIVDYTTN